MMMRLAEERGAYRYILKLDERPGNRGQMLVGFSHTPGVNPASLDPELSDAAMEIDLEMFGPQFSKTCRKKKT